MRAEDRIVLKEIQNRNTEVFKSLFLEYRSELICYAEQFVFDIQHCEDIVVDLFIHLWENASKIEITTSLKSYLYQSVRNGCLNYLKKIKISSKHNEIFYKNLSEAIDTEKDDSVLTKAKVRNAIDSLPEQMSIIVKMKYLEEKKQKEIAKALNISESTVKTQLSRGRDKLRKLLYNYRLF